MTLIQDNQSPYLTFLEDTAPTTPSSGLQAIFIDSANHHLKMINSSGGITDLEAVSGGAIYPQRGSLMFDEFTVITGCGGSLIPFMSASQKYGYTSYQTSAGNGDKVGASLMGKIGTYNFFALGYGETDLGKVDWAVDGSVFITGQDWYSGVIAVNGIKTGTFTLANSGRHVLTATINGKNGASSGYNFFLTKVWWSFATETQEP